MIGFADVVVKMRAQDGAAVDVYFLFEHKSFNDKRVLLQFLDYMLLMWRRDFDNDRPFRVIIPIVFFHGKGEWQIPTRFVDQFEVSDDLKQFIFDFEYVLFDTNLRDWRDEKNEPLKKFAHWLNQPRAVKLCVPEIWEE